MAMRYGRVPWGEELMMFVVGVDRADAESYFGPNAALAGVTPVAVEPGCYGPFPESDEDARGEWVFTLAAVRAMSDSGHPLALDLPILARVVEQARAASGLGDV